MIKIIMKLYSTLAVIGLFFIIPVSGIFGVEVDQIDGLLHEKISSHCAFEKAKAKLQADKLILPTMFSI